MNYMAAGILLLAIHSALGESGASPFDEENEEFKADFECVSTVTLQLTELTCYLPNALDTDSGNVDIYVCDSEQHIGDQNEPCPKMTRTANGYKLADVYETEEYTVCVGKNMCKNVKIKDIVLADPPFNLTVAYNKQENEYKIAFKEPYSKMELLGDNLQYEIILRKEDEEWPECNQEEILKKMCIQTPYNEVLIPGKKLESVTKYAAKVRTRPNRSFFNGPWSSWCAASVFETSSTNTQQAADGRILITILVITGSVIFIIFIISIIFWKRRIKPLLWPEIPDHKKTLEKFSKNAIKQHYITFNPDLYEDTVINRVEDIQVKELEEEPTDSPPGEEETFFPCHTEDIQSGKDSRVTACETSQLPTAKTTVLFSENDGPQRNVPLDHIPDVETHRAIPAATPDVPQTCAGGIDRCNPRDSITTALSPHTMENRPSSDDARETPGGFKVFPWEEAYVAMSAFKTPVSSAN
ncbi:interleukin-7 receptor subunit alpha [Spea bombifrons]|uniref:interleukin-7 receptor subunit alpha n=1 Tax=Spea bombifrons TaxID=233779 RepID=UPI00234A1E1D|nr:interleukin-7 receptor subunit alpha [Spea bombifrons]